MAIFATSGGPGNATTNLAFLIYARALLQFDVGGASAGGVVAIVLANIVATLEQRELKPFVYHTKGTLAALGHFKGIGTVYGIKIRGMVAWWVWRSYYLFQMPFWSRRLRIVIDWTIALFFKNDIVKLDFSTGATVTSPVEPELSDAAG